MGPCAKTTVTCKITSPSGEVFVGQNWCLNPQLVCPREPRDGYDKCKTICQQVGHAEIVALNLAGDAAIGGTAEVEGHTYACQNCQEALYAKVKWINVRKSLSQPVIYSGEREHKEGCCGRTIVERCEGCPYATSNS